MKSVVKPLSIASTLLYLAGIIYTLIYLYRLPDSLMKASAVLDLETIPEITPLLHQSFLVVSGALAVGLLSIILQVMSATRSNKENIVYVEKFKKKEEDVLQNSEKAGGEEEQYDTSSLTEEILEKIKSASSSQEGPDEILEKALRTVCVQLEASQGAVYVAKEVEENRFVEMRASFAYMKPESATLRFEYGEGLPGQVIKEGNMTIIDAVPDGYIKILSGLGKASPKHLMLTPVKSNKKVLGVVEIASFTPFTKQHQEITRQAFSILAKHFAKSSELISASVETEAVEEMEEDNSQNI